MSVIIRLQGLPLSAASADIRTFFSGLRIPDGSVHIVGGPDGDAFIGFATDEDARQAMRKNNGRIHNTEIRLFLSSRTEMNAVIEEARAANAPPPTARFPTLNGPSSQDRPSVDIRSDIGYTRNAYNPYEQPRNTSVPAFRTEALHPNEYPFDRNAQKQRSFGEDDRRRGMVDRGGNNEELTRGRPSFDNQRQYSRVEDTFRKSAPSESCESPSMMWPPRDSPPRHSNRVDDSQGNSSTAYTRGSTDRRFSTTTDKMRANENDGPGRQPSTSMNAFGGNVKREEDSRRRDDLPAKELKEESWKDGRYEKSSDWRMAENNAGVNNSSTNQPFDQRKDGHPSLVNTAFPVPVHSNGKSVTTAKDPFPRGTFFPSVPSRPQIPHIVPFPIPLTTPLSKPVEEVFVELSRLPPDLLRPTNLETFLAPSTPLTLSSVKVVYGPGGVHLHSLVRFTSAMEAFKALQKDGDQGIRIRPSTKETFDGAVDGIVGCNGRINTPLPLIPPVMMQQMMGVPQAGVKEDRGERRSKSPHGRDDRRGFKRDRYSPDRYRRRRERSISPVRSKRIRGGEDRLCVLISNAPFKARDTQIRLCFEEQRIVSCKKVFNEDDSPSDKWIIDFDTTEDQNRACEVNEELSGRRIRVSRIDTTEADRLLRIRPGFDNDGRRVEKRDDGGERRRDSSELNTENGRDSHRMGFFSGPVFTPNPPIRGIPRGGMRGGGRGRGLLVPPIVDLNPNVPSFPPRGRGRGRGVVPMGGQLHERLPEEVILVCNLPPIPNPLILLETLCVSPDRVGNILQVAEDMAVLHLLSTQETLQIASRSHPPLDGRTLILTVLPQWKVAEEVTRRKDQASLDSEMARQMGAPGCVISCTGLPTNVNLEEVLTFMEAFHVIESSVRMRLGEGDMPTGECMLAVENEKSANLAVQTLNGHTLRGHTVSLRLV